MLWYKCVLWINQAYLNALSNQILWAFDHIRPFRRNRFVIPNYLTEVLMLDRTSSKLNPGDESNSNNISVRNLGADTRRISSFLLVAYLTSSNRRRKNCGFLRSSFYAISLVRRKREFSRIEKHSWHHLDTAIRIREVPWLIASKLEVTLFW